MKKKTAAELRQIIAESRQRITILTPGYRQIRRILTRFNLELGQAICENHDAQEKLLHRSKKTPAKKTSAKTSAKTSIKNELLKMPKDELLALLNELK